MVEAPTLREMLDAGVHVVNLEKTAEKLAEAVNFIKKEAASGKVFIFVGTKKQSGIIIKEAAISCGMPYVNVRWLGGTLTNFDMIQNSVKTFRKQKEELENPNSELSKSELSKIRKEV